MSAWRFGTPTALFLLVLLPIAVAIARRRVTPRGAIVRRLLVFALVIVALGSPYFPVHGGDLSVIFAVDRSDSISGDQGQAAQEFVRMAAARRRPGDRIGLVTFGADAIVEELPSAQPQLAFSSQPIGSATDIGQAIRAALAALPPDGGRRIVVLSDGNDNRGVLSDALALARGEGVEVSAVPLAADRIGDVYVDDVVAPPEVRVGEQFTVKVAVVAATAATALLTTTAGGRIIDRRTLEVQPGRTIIALPQVARAEGLVLYAATLTTDLGGTDANKRAEAVVIVRGTPIVWYIAQQPGPLVRLLAAQGVRVQHLTPEALPTAAAGFRGPSAVVLDDVPAMRFSPAQMAALRDYVGRLGGGVIAVGGPHSFGLGGYAGTALEEMLPVSMDMRHRLAMPSIAVILVIDASGSMGPFGLEIAKIELAKEISQSVIDLLGERDLVGVIAFDQEVHWLVLPTEARNRDRILELVSRVQAGGGTDMYPALRLAYDYLRQARAKLRHVIVLSDGQTDPGDFQMLVTRTAADKITTSAVAIGSDADLEFMQRVSRWGGGGFHTTRDLATIPQIITAEALIASRAYVVEERFTPQIVRAGFVDDFAMPPLLGYVATAPKPAATLHLVSAQDDPLLASWQYGIGRAVAFTSDASTRWAANWMRWADAGRFWSRVVRWVSRAEDDDLQVAVDRQGDTALVIADAVTEAGTPLDGLALEAGVTGPVNTRITLVQTAPGRYEGRLQASAQGAYALAVAARDPDGRVRVKTSGFVVPYSPELKALGVNRALLARIAEATGGRLLSDPAAAVAPMRTTRSTANTWPVFASTALVLFVVDLAVRRMPAIAPHLAAIVGAIRGRATRPPTTQETEEERQYAESDRWKFIAPDAAASESMQEAARLYIARLKAAKREERRKRDPRS
jgi:Mg-chelatase subunit ChlD